MKLSKLNLSSFPLFSLCIFLLVMGTAIFSSCGEKKHSVRQIRDAKAPYIPRPQERAMIQPLFLQNKKANLGLPKDISGGSGLGGAITREQVTYKNPDNHTDMLRTTP